MTVDANQLIKSDKWQLLSPTCDEMLRFSDAETSLDEMPVPWTSQGGYLCQHFAPVLGWVVVRRKLG